MSYDEQYQADSCAGCREYEQERVRQAREIERLRIKCGPDEMIEGDYAKLLLLEDRLEKAEGLLREAVQNGGVFPRGWIGRVKEVIGERDSARAVPTEP